ncbi:OLC1v1010039C1 [Oldenlandia corymbosa var. corymbosa]|uniref:OLC1v1010039C1 n=1 Tax=Oldenlandia corymbosa var. corymbosa TaxID=529605 RepID=A0AAV1DQC1_OLDCO|nr:OLC1v1010039C1 [Oldenlandia corymbosa var. corymbosa]
MVTRKSVAPAKVGLEAAGENGSGDIPKKSDYEQSREERIKQNLERMKNLGILDLSLKLKSMNKPTPKSTPSFRRTFEHATPLPPSGPRRRSSRLQNATPVSYTEVPLKNKDNSSEDEHDFQREEGSKPESYTEEHEKLLGSTEMSWTLFVDGYASNGKRIYDPVKGKTCHQCRQKTLGHRTHCSQCNKVQGQFCGDCLYMRYGEHVLEANQNPNWICPVCRGICNCSLCRQAKGWAPTGTLYKKISSLGFKSVAHYIIQTRQKKSVSEVTSDVEVPISAKRSLPFSSTEETPMENRSSGFKTIPQGLDHGQSEGQVTDVCIGVGKEEERQCVLDNEMAECKSNLEDNSLLIMKPALAADGISGEPRLQQGIGSETDVQEGSKVLLVDSAETFTMLALPETSLNLTGVPNSENGTILMKHDNNDEGLCHLGKRDVECFAAPESSRNSKGAKDERLDVEHQISSDISSTCTVEATVNHLSSTTSTVTQVPVVSPPTTLATVNHPPIATPIVAPAEATDSIARRLRPRRGKIMELEEQESTGVQQLDNVACPLNPVTPVTCSKSNRKRIRSSEPSPNSIAGRLRQRRLECRVV